MAPTAPRSPEGITVNIVVEPVDSSSPGKKKKIKACMNEQLKLKRLTMKKR